MSGSREARLIGALQLMPDNDGIGVPLFTAENQMFVPEMDGEFKVVAFTEFYNEQGFKVVYQLPDHYHGRIVRVGDPTPIPFWTSHSCYVVEGDAEKENLEKQFGVVARTDPVLKDLGRMLDDARNGRISARIAEWVAEELSAGFDDVLIEPPSRTRYWISRYRVALEQARKITQPPHPIDVRLRNAANRWLQKFAVKSDPSMLGGVLGSSAQGIFSALQIRNILFAYIIHKLAVGHTAHLEVIHKEDTAQTVFSDGLYTHFIQNGWPHVPFKYEQIDLVDFMKAAINDGVRAAKLAPAVKLARLLFGLKDAPHAVEDHVMLYIPRALDLYKERSNEARSQFFQHPMTTDLRDWAREVLDLYNVVSQLSCIAFGKDRMVGEMIHGRFGVSARDVAEWQMWAGSARIIS